MLLCFAIPVLPQGLILGVKGGVRLTGDTPSYTPATSNSKRYVIGPMIDVALPFHFAFEADALCSRLGNTVYIPLIANEVTTRTIANAWAFPLLLKYRLPERRIRPFLSAGIAPRRAGGSAHTIHYGYYPGDITFFSADWRAHDHALVFGGGIDFLVRRVRISPELRYLRWNVPSRPAPHDTAFYLQSVSNNEVQFLLGIGWGTR